MVVTESRKKNSLSSSDDPKFVGGSLCLDFVNTVDAWVSAPQEKARDKSLPDYFDMPVREKIADYRDLTRWGLLAGAVSPSEAAGLTRYAAKHASAAVAAHHRALRLRRVLYRTFKAHLEGWEPDSDDLELLHRELAVARKHERLTHTPGGFQWAWDDSGDALDRILWPVARAAADLLTSPELARLRQCKGDECGWLFLDTSRNRSRQWCDMSDCGNLSKVRRFRERH